MHQALYWVRRVLYILIIVLAVRVWWYMTGLVNDLLSFQITLYGYMLEGQQAIGTVSDTATGLRNQAQTFFGRGQEPSVAWDVSLRLTEQELTDRLSVFAQKIALFSLLLGTILGLTTYLLLTKIIFGIREHIRTINQFIQ